MKISYSLILAALLIGACQPQKKAENMKKMQHPSHKYTFVDLQSNAVNYLETNYVPIYSDIYHIDGTKRFLLTSTLSIRNTSLTDTAYVFSANYNDSYGKQLRKYIDSTILLKPLESIEFVVEYQEDQGGAGASFLVDWGARENAGQLLIQAVMTGTSNQQGLSFLTEAKIVKQMFRD
ncbi:DUF3124 domain-containing protein [Mangrovibacterium marinum]|uniref:Uncharacterized protein DUF3124 n=1 Tax=Mangrovibacterium marinum TaxID=1639118 RepID=A0A2T5C575_9BACT|nr:DUF3124 domain-containing protein [Mangrovibacterium marinum]PTN10070.1 uncharacterized protein DUF3124 [Mangrovibacterium marinum]